MIIDKLKDPKVTEAFQAMIGGKFAPLTVIETDNDADVDTFINTFNTAVTNTASQILGKHRRIKKPWVTANVLDLCDRRELKKKKKEPDGAKEYRAISQEIKNGMKRAKENWIEEQCQGIEDSLKTNNSKKAY